MRRPTARRQRLVRLRNDVTIGAHLHKVYQLRLVVSSKRNCNLSDLHQECMDVSIQARYMIGVVYLANGNESCTWSRVIILLRATASCTGTGDALGAQSTLLEVHRGERLSHGRFVFDLR